MKERLKILVTGAAGYIGSVLTQYLAREGYQVIAFDNFYYTQHNVREIVDANCSTVGCKPIWIEGDVTNSQSMKNAMADADFIIPLAAIVGAPICEKNPVLARQVNLESIELILSHKRNGQKIIFPNTNSGYGRGAVGTAYCTEDSLLDPISLYGELKVRAEKIILNDGDGVVFRLATVFGASPRPRIDLLVNNMVYEAWMTHKIKIYEGHFKRNYIHVVDVARAFTFVLENFSQARGNVFNLGLSSANLSKRELCEEIKKQITQLNIQEDREGRDPDQRNYIVSNDKIEGLGFFPVTTLREGIAELISFYRSNIIDIKKCRNY